MLKEVKLKETSKAVVAQKAQHQRSVKALQAEKRAEAAKEARLIADLKITLKNKEKVSCKINHDFNRISRYFSHLKL